MRKLDGKIALVTGASKYAAFTALDPFFNIIQEGLAGLVDGDHYFETISEHAVFEFRYVFPGWPASISGRDPLMALYAGYGDNMVLHKADALVVHHSQDDPRVLILEYEVRGKAVRTGILYHKSLRLDHHHRRTEDRALEGLHGLAGRHVCAQRLRMTSSEKSVYCQIISAQKIQGCRLEKPLTPAPHGKNVEQKQEEIDE